MAGNLYDAAYNLEKAIRHSEELERLRKLYAKVNSDDSTRRMFENFRNSQMRLQEKQMAGQEITEAEVQQIQNTIEVIRHNKSISQLIEAEQRMSLIITELNKIIMKPLEELYGVPNENNHV
ncbi:YlbF family regulator [Bacillus aquiflavi]|uniref:YlbF family regulator n=1 Tax=Bacillus aquiflavi TaxID=2672567 RepID=UPI001CA9F008|nr:YlbF family regulator [Bacillus aquiflavi]UAC48958.1 YlbF family regulator [Bacillus aquiflavi]